MSRVLTATRGRKPRANFANDRASAWAATHGTRPAICQRVMTGRVAGTHGTITYGERKVEMTIGTETLGLRVTRGKLDRHGRFHDNWPCIFLLWRGRRVG
jgi:hypothetical protein